MLTPEQRKEKLQTVFRVASGNFLEMYDFMIFGYFSAAIGRAYFPASSEFASLMFSMTLLSAGWRRSVALGSRPAPGLNNLPWPQATCGAAFAHTREHSRCFPFGASRRGTARSAGARQLA